MAPPTHIPRRDDQWINQRNAPAPSCCNKTRYILLTPRIRCVCDTVPPLLHCDVTSYVVSYAHKQSKACLDHVTTKKSRMWNVKMRVYDGKRVVFSTTCDVSVVTHLLLVTGRHENTWTWFLQTTFRRKSVLEILQNMWNCSLKPFWAKRPDTNWFFYPNVFFVLW